MKSPTMRHHHPSPKHHTVHLTTIMSKESLSGMSSPMMKSERYDKTEEPPKKEEFQLSPKKLSKLGLFRRCFAVVVVEINSDHNENLLFRPFD